MKQQGLGPEKNILFASQGDRFNYFLKYTMAMIEEVIEAYLDELSKMVGSPEDYAKNHPNGVDLQHVWALKIPEIVCRNLIGANGELKDIYFKEGNTVEVTPASFEGDE